MDHNTVYQDFEITLGQRLKSYLDYHSLQFAATICFIDNI